MTQLPGDRPERQRNFHGTKGEHLFPHPETYEPRRTRWTAWERRYAAHLDRHRELAANPEPQDGDPQVVLDLFAHIEVLKSIIKKETQLILAIRQKQAAGREIDERELRAVLNRGGET